MELSTEAVVAMSAAAGGVVGKIVSVITGGQTVKKAELDVVRVQAEAAVASADAASTQAEAAKVQAEAARTAARANELQTELIRQMQRNSDKFYEDERSRLMRVADLAKVELDRVAKETSIARKDTADKLEAAIVELKGMRDHLAQMQIEMDECKEDRDRLKAKTDEMQGVQAEAVVRINDIENTYVKKEGGQ